MDSKLKRLFIIPFLILLCAAQRGEQGILTQTVAGAGGTWTLVQFKYYDNAGGGTGGSACSSGTTSCTVTIAAPTAGNTLVAIGFPAPTSGTLTMNSTPTGGETWTHCGGTNGCAFGATANGSLDAWYSIGVTATGQTSVTCHWSGNAVAYNGCGIAEVHWSGSTVTFDTSAGNNSVAVSGGSCAGAALTLTGSDDYIFEAAAPSNAITALTGSGYTNPQQFYGSFGQAGQLNATSGAAPSWTDASGTCAIMGIALKGS